MTTILVCIFIACNLALIVSMNVCSHLINIIEKYFFRSFLGCSFYRHYNK